MNAFILLFFIFTMMKMFLQNTTQFQHVDRPFFNRKWGACTKLTHQVDKELYAVIDLIIVNIKLQKSNTIEITF